MSTLANGALDALLGSQCGMCGVAGPPLCAQCMQWIDTHARLGAQVRSTVAGLDALTWGAAYRAPLDELVHAAKFRSDTAATRTLGALLWARLRALGPLEIDVLIPIPLGADRLAQRGYNQAALIARVIASGCAKPLDLRTLRRVRSTPALATLDRAARQDAVRGAFGASQRIDGRRVLLIDDVCTTGATLSAAAMALRAAGARAVLGAVALRTPLMTDL